MTHDYECPWCEDMTPAPEDDGPAVCVHCGARLSFSVDAEVRNGDWRDCSGFALVEKGRVCWEETT